MRLEPDARYANLDPRRLGLDLNAVVLDDDGTLRLGTVPADPVEVGPPLELLEAFRGPAGIAVDRRGNVYVSDTAGHRVLRIDCFGQVEPLRCLRGPGSRPGELNAPRGLAVDDLDTLYVADSGNHRIQAVDLRALQVRGVFGQADPYAEPRPGSGAGDLDEPWDLAADAHGGLYVSERGNRRLQKFDAHGHFDVSFMAADRPSAPSYLAVGVLDGRELLLVLNEETSGGTKLLVYALDGRFERLLTERWNDELARSAPAILEQPPAGLAVGESVLVLGDADNSRVLSFDEQGRFLGPARGPRTRVAALGIDCDGRVVLHPGGGMAVRFAGDATAASGSFRIGPFAASQTEQQPAQWQRLLVRAEGLEGGAHLRLFTCTTDAPGDVPPPLPVAGGIPPPEPTPLGQWRAAPPDSLDQLVLNEPGRFLWIAGMLQAGSEGGPVLRGLRVSWDEEGLLSHLPAVYSREPESRRFLERALALFATAIGDLLGKFEALPGLLDPGSAPDHPDERWLDWLAGWLAFDLDDRWSEQKRRNVLARAFELAGRRGTAASLRELVQLSLGAPVVVTEPARFADLWSLGARDSQLGFTTGLAPAASQGAVIDTTAIVERSHLISADENGAPLFSDLAHHFCVHAYAADLPEPGSRELLEGLIARERPAHTTSHLCVIEPRARVGFQARLGVDAVVGAHSVPLRLGTRGELGGTAALADDRSAALADDRSAAGAQVGRVSIPGSTS